MSFFIFFMVAKKHKMPKNHMVQLGCKHALANSLMGGNVYEAFLCFQKKLHPSLEMIPSKRCCSKLGLNFLFRKFHKL
jgi:hypothetical protein